MRTRHPYRRGRKLRRLLTGCCAVLGFAAGVHLLALTLPALDGAVERLALFSAGLPANASPQSDDADSGPESQTTTPQTAAASVATPTGVIRREQYLAGAAPLYIPLQNGAAIQNMSDLAYDAVAAEVAKPPVVSITGSGKPEVLILHSRTTQAYAPTQSDRFDPTAAVQSDDKSKNVVYVGDKIEAELQKAGIGVLHEFARQDENPDAADATAAATVARYLKKYPTIRLVLDVRRDAIHKSDSERIAPAATIDGKSCAQVLLVSDSARTATDPRILQNLRLSARLAEQAEADSKGLMRPILLDDRAEAPPLADNFLLIEIGSDANSLDEAAVAGTLLGRALAKVLLTLK